MTTMGSDAVMKNSQAIWQLYLVRLQDRLVRSQPHSSRSTNGDRIQTLSGTAFAGCARNQISTIWLIPSQAHPAQFQAPQQSAQEP